MECYFSGTGDMFAALMLVRLREAVSKIPGLGQTAAWLSPDEVDEVDLPLAKAAERVLASMQEVLARTKKSRDEELERFQRKGAGVEDSGSYDEEKEMHLRQTKAAEVRLVRNLDCLRNPQLMFQAEKVD